MPADDEAKRDATHEAMHEATHEATHETIEPEKFAHENCVVVERKLFIHS